MTPDIQADLDAARALAEAGVPVFCAYPDSEGKTASGRQTGYMLPKNWQNTSPNPAYISAWKPGMALCAVMGHVLDLVDDDPRNRNGDLTALNGIMPTIYAKAATPSGGTHDFIAALGAGSRDALLPGIDIKAGDENGTSRGFAFIAPTVRVSKTTGERTAYQWIIRPDPDRLRDTANDTSGRQLAELIRRSRPGRHAAPTTSGIFTQPADARHVGPIPYGEHHTQLTAYAGSLRSRAIPQHEAEILILHRLKDCVQPPGADRELFTDAETIGLLRDVYSRYTAGDPAADAAAPADPPAGLPETDLGALAEKGIEPPELIAGGMLYPGSVHCLAGVPGGGKTTLMAWWMLEHIRAGGRVLLMDEESGADQAASKFLDLGAVPAELSPPYFTYVPFPSRSWSAVDLMLLHTLIAERQPGIIGWDSIAAFLAIAGADENSATDVTRFWQAVLVPCARRFGAAVIGIDHITKNGEHGGYGRGSGAKKAASDVQYIIETIKPFNRHNDGLLRLTTQPGKDRQGWLAMAYECRVKVADTMSIDISEAPATPIDGDVVMRPAKRKVWEALNTIATEGNPATIGQLNDWIAQRYANGLKRQTMSTHLNELAADGLADSVSVRPGQEKFWYPITLSASADASALTCLSASAPLTGADATGDTNALPFRQPR